MRAARIRHSAVPMLLALVGLVAAMAGCSSSSSTSVPEPPSGRVSDEQVLRLEQGSSLDVVKAELGEPVSEFSSGGETTLNYPSWQLHFEGGALDQRIREESKNSSGLTGSKLDRRVLSQLSLGMSAQEVEEKLGAPMAAEEIFEEAKEPDRILRYESWELYFEQERLVRRTRY